MEEAPEKGKESSHSVHGNGMNEEWNEKMFIKNNRRPHYNRSV
jgi:hypothetical protein